MLDKQSAPTIRDVAKLAGVSVGTVSRVMNQQKVGASYRQRVLEAAQRLNFPLNRSAQAPRSETGSTVALILPDLLDPFRGDFALRVFDSLAKNGYSMLLFLTHGKAENEADCLRQACDHGADGVIALCRSELEAEQGVALVNIDSARASRYPSVTSDNFGTGQLAALTLQRLGCKRLLGLQEQRASFGEGQKRLLGFELACQGQGMPYDLFRSAQADREPIWRFLREHLRETGLDYDGIFCTSDELVYQVRQYLTDCGISVPEQVQMIGCGGMTQDEVRSFTCSTIRIPVQEMAETAVDLVLGKRELQGSICLGVEYVPGKTTRQEGAAS